jgi:hypothetical protein
MTRIRLIMLTLLTVFAIGAIGVTSAFAEGATDEYEGTGATTGKQLNTQVFTVKAGKVECKKAKFTDSLTGSAKTFKATFEYTECKAFGATATVAANGCEYEFLTPADIPSGSESPDTHHTANVNLVCPTGKTVTIKTGICEVTVGTQGPLSSVEAINLANGNLEVIANVGSIVYTQIGALCPNGGGGTFANGTYKGSVEDGPLKIN